MKRTTDSPWFWLFVFCGFGFLVLMIVDDKVTRRTQGFSERAPTRAPESQTAPNRAIQKTPNSTRPETVPRNTPSFALLKIILALAALIGLALHVRGAVVARGATSP